MAHLLVLTGVNQRLRIPLAKDRTVLGRDGRCDVVLDDCMINPSPDALKDSISRRHAVISCLEGKYYIEDGDGQGKESRNGTFVNDRKLDPPGQRFLLRENDRIRICDFACTFHEGAAVLPLPDDLRRQTPTAEAPEDSSSVESSINYESSSQLLETQPAEKLKVLLEISNNLSKTLDLDALLPQIVDDLFQLFKQADRGFVILWDETTRKLVPRVFKARQAGREADARFSASIVRRCLEKAQAVLGNDVVKQFPDSGSISDLPIRSLMCAPLWFQDGRPLGAIQLDTWEPRRKFTQEDLNLLMGVASQASIALSNARLYQDSLAHQRRERDLELARQVEFALLPQQLPEVPGYEFTAAYEPAQEIGGDYYDFIPLSGGRLAVLLGDVAGKGVAGALVMVKFSVEARSCLLSEPDLAAAVGRLNDVMNRLRLLSTFVTLAALVLDPGSHTVTLVNAGHPSPLLVRRGGAAVEEATPLANVDFPIGIGESQAFTAGQVALAPGDGLVVFSDGVTEALDAQGRQFGKARVKAVLGEGLFSAQGAGDRLLLAVKQHAAGCAQHDDITLVCFGRVS
jgi:serine phosphatase RsbU (regulator of sigma subunit)/pSer/pThr/pTyr-binding forkhead associated (FHA) protein